MEPSSDFVQGWNQALDKIELELRRTFSHLWPHDVTAAKRCQSLKLREPKGPISPEDRFIEHAHDGKDGHDDRGEGSANEDA